MDKSDIKKKGGLQVAAVFPPGIVKVTYNHLPD